MHIQFNEISSYDSGYCEELLERDLAIAFLSVCLSVKRVHCDKTK